MTVEIPSSNSTTRKTAQSQGKKTLALPKAKRLPQINEQVNDAETERRVVQQQKLVDLKNTQKALLSPVNPLQSPKAPRAKARHDLLQSTALDATLNFHHQLRGMNELKLPSTIDNKLSREQMNNTFEQWLKIASENKINAKNSWDFGLIDYFSDLRVLQEGDAINFQKASCTLDSCIKIYSSRVDAVADETGKLLNGLVESNPSKNLTQGQGGIETDEEEEETIPQAIRKKGGKSSKYTETLAKNSETLNLKSFELEFQMDPLFRKICALDERGVSGLFFYNLSTTSEGLMLLDSSDTKLQPNTHRVPELTLKDNELNLGLFQGIESLLDTELLSHAEICPSFKQFDLLTGNFENSAKNQDFSEELSKVLEKVGNMNIEANPNAPVYAIESVYFGDSTQLSNTVNVYDGVHFADNEAWLQDSDDNTEAVPLSSIPFSSDNIINRDEYLDGKLRLSITAEEGPDACISTGPSSGFEPIPELSLTLNNDAFSYFEDGPGGLNKNWAGPEHWRVSRIREPPLSLQPITKKVTSKKEKGPLVSIDFENASSVNIKALFNTSNLSIALSKENYIQKKNKDKNLLPEDLGIQMKQVLSLISKPEWIISKAFMRKLGISKDNPNDEGPIGKASEQLTEGMAAQVIKRLQENLMSTNVASPVPEGFYTSFIFGSYDLEASSTGLFGEDSGETQSNETFANTMEGLSEESENEIQLQLPFSQSNHQNIHQGDATTAVAPKFVKFKPINYSKFAKRVDIHRLKENIWNQIERNSLKNPVQFTNVVSSLSSCYSMDRLKDITIPYCFVSLLHIASEENLDLTSVHDHQDIFIQRTAPAAAKS